MGRNSRYSEHASVKGFCGEEAKGPSRTAGCLQREAGRSEGPAEEVRGK